MPEFRLPRATYCTSPRLISSNFISFHLISAEGMTVSLQENAVGNTGTQDPRYEWTQIGGDPQIEFEEVDTSRQITPHGPQVDSDFLLTFWLVVTIKDGIVSSDEVKIMIHDLPAPADDDDSNDEKDQED